MQEVSGTGSWEEMQTGVPWQLRWACPSFYFSQYILREDKRTRWKRKETRLLPATYPKLCPREDRRLFPGLPTGEKRSG
jgi:hypothetical protein